jgi:hypothetical protein
MRDMSGAGPCGVIVHGVWQSLHPPIVTRYSPRAIMAARSASGEGTGASARAVCVFRESNVPITAPVATSTTTSTAARLVSNDPADDIDFYSRSRWGIMRRFRARGQ